MSKVTRLHILNLDLRLLSLLLSMMVLVVGCGYSFEFKRVDAQEQEDPITVIRRDLRQVKADHRVAIFDLQKEQKDLVASFQAELVRIGKANEGLGQGFLQFKRELEDTKTALQQKKADTAEQFSEMENQHRLIHGRIEEEANRNKQMSSNASNYTLGELESFQKAMDARLLALENKASSRNKVLRDQLTRLKKKAEGASDDLRKQVKSVLEKNLGIQKSSAGQGKVLKTMSDQLAQLVDKVVPAINRLAERLDNIEWQVDKLKDEFDLKALTLRLTSLRDAVDVQRQSLEMLGNTLTSQVDKQAALLQKTGRRLKDLEAKTAQ